MFSSSKNNLRNIFPSSLKRFLILFKTTLSQEQKYRVVLKRLRAKQSLHNYLSQVVKEKSLWEKLLAHVIIIRRYLQA